MSKRNHHNEKIIIVDTPTKTLDLSKADDPSWDDCFNDSDLNDLDDLDDDLDDLNDRNDDSDTNDDEDGDDDIFGKKTTSAIARLKARSANHAGLKTKKVNRPRAPRSGQPQTRKKVTRIPAVQAINNRTALEPDDKAISSLWGCKSIDDVKSMHRGWHDRTRLKCDLSIKHRKLQEDTRMKIAALLDGTATGTPTLVSHQALALCWETLSRNLHAQTKDDPDMEFGLVTFIDGRGGTSTNKPFIKLHNSQEHALKVVRKMSKNFIGVTELAMFNSHQHSDGGRHIQVHEHFLLWGHGAISQAQKVAHTWMKEFKPNITDAPQIDVRKVEGTELNLARVCAYLFKSPHKCMTWNPNTSQMNQSEKGDRRIRYLRMAEIRSAMNVKDILMAGGKGLTMRKDLLDHLDGTFRSLVPVDNRIMHPDEVGRFWCAVNLELNRKQWELPVIARQP